MSETSTKNDNKKVSDRLHSASVGFLYPAILGSTIYGVIDYLILGNNVKFDFQVWLGLFTALAIVTLYYCDMVFTNSEESKEGYSIEQFIYELLIVFSLFPAVQAAVGNEEFLKSVPFPAVTYLAFAKFFCVLWELRAPSSQNKCAIISFGTFFILYFLIAALIFCGCLTPPFSGVLTLLLVAIDCFVFMKFGNDIKKCLCVRKKHES